MSQFSKSITMTRCELLRLKEAAGQVIRVHAGRLWITHEDEGVDHVLEPGDAFTVHADGLTLVSALRASALSVTMQDAAAPLVLAAAL